MPDYRRVIEVRLQEIDAAMVQTDAAAGTVVLDQSTVGRLTRVDAMQQQVMAAGMPERLGSPKLGLVAALDRIAAGTYGLCCECAVGM